jgi:hypothetical protein
MNPPIPRLANMCDRTTTAAPSAMSKNSDRNPFDRTQPHQDRDQLPSRCHARSKNATHAARVSAANAILDRGWGKPTRSPENGDDGALELIHLASANNFIRAGYRLYQPRYPWGWPHTCTGGIASCGEGRPESSNRIARALKANLARSAEDVRRSRSKRGGRAPPGSFVFLETLPCLP